MAQGRFVGLSDEQWTVFKQFLPDPATYVGPKGGRRPQNLRGAMNGILWVLISGGKWCDIPTGPQFAPKSTCHYWFKLLSHDGTMRKLANNIMVLADIGNQINWDKSYIDGSFSPREGWGRRRGSRLRP